MKKRDRRLKEFLDYHLDLLSLNHDVERNPKAGAYIFHNTEIGDFTYYPKSDKLQLHTGSEWISNGLDFMYENIRIEK